MCRAARRCAAGTWVGWAALACAPDDQASSGRCDAVGGASPIPSCLHLQHCGRARRLLIRRPRLLHVDQRPAAAEFLLRDACLPRLHAGLLRGGLRPDWRLHRFHDPGYGSVRPAEQLCDRVARYACGVRGAGSRLAGGVHRAGTADRHARFGGPRLLLQEERGTSSADLTVPAAASFPAPTLSHAGPSGLWRVP